MNAFLAAESLFAVSCGGNFTPFETTDHSIRGTGDNGDGQLDGHSVAGPTNHPKAIGPVLILSASE